MGLPCTYQSNSRTSPNPLKLLTRFALPVILLAALRPLDAQVPHLTVVITAEQFRADYIKNYSADFSANGIRRLITRGAYFERCRFGHAANLAAPNSATLATGAYPVTHGIIGNRWYDRETRGVVSAMGAPLKYSPENLSGSTVADELRLASGGGSRVVAVSEGAAPAVFLGGRHPNGSYWMGESGEFETSGYYRADIPGWVQSFNKGAPITLAAAKNWMAVDAAPHAKPLRVLPGLTGELSESYSAFYRSSPFVMRRTFDFASAAIKAEGLGTRSHPDLLFVNLSAPALLALEVGADSPLMRDMVLQLDRELGRFVDWLGGEFGFDRVSIVFTGLHGSPVTPELASLVGPGGGRIKGESVVEAIDAALEAEFGAGPAVEKYVYPYVTFNDRFHRMGRDRRLHGLDVAGEAATALAGIASYYAPQLTNRSGGNAQRRSWKPGRSGDLMLVYDPYFTEHSGEDRGTGPGSMYRYDSDVPLVFYGQQFRAMQSMREVDAASIAPTLAALLNTALPSSTDAPILHEAFVDKPTLAPAAKPAPRKETTKSDSPTVAR